MMLLNQFNALAIGQFTNTAKWWELTQAVQKVKSFFLVGNLLTAPATGTRQLFYNLVTGRIRTAFIEFCESIKKGNYGFVTNVSQSKSNGLHSGLTKKLYIAVAKIITTRVSKMTEKNFIINYLPCLFSFSRQASFTHELKLPFPATNSICASKSSSKRICFVVLFGRSKCFLSFLSCIGSYRYDKLNLKGSYHYISNYFKKAMPRSAGTLSRHLTKPLNEVMIMANRYDSAHLRAEQPKLYKFYDRSTTQVVQSIAPTERQARKILGKQSLIFIARIRLYPVIESSKKWGGYSHV